jgi:disulfide bond formation protein DsbB
MENMESMQTNDSPIQLTNEMKDYLLQTSKWGKFLAIMGYIGMGLLIVLGFAVMIGLSIGSRHSITPFPLGLVGLLYIAIAAVYYFPVTFLYKFSVGIKKGLLANDQQDVATGFQNLKSLFKFIGILTIVMLSIYFFVLLIVLPLTLAFTK